MHLSVINLKVKIIRDFQDFVLKALHPKTKTWKSRKFYKNAIILKYENVASKTNSNWFIDIVQMAYYPTCLFRENKNVPLFYFLPLSLKLMKLYAPIFVTFRVSFYDFEHLKL